MDKYIKIGFIGNHRYDLNSEQKDKIISILDKYDNIIVLHGDSIGSDTDFHNLCMNYRKEHPNKKIRI
jgi:metallophosphoesterase superfamily enzyme